MPTAFKKNNKELTHRRNLTSLVSSKSLSKVSAFGISALTTLLTILSVIMFAPGANAAMVSFGPIFPDPVSVNEDNAAQIPDASESLPVQQFFEGFMNFVHKDEAKIVLTSNTGVEVINGNSGQTINELLSTRNESMSNYKTEDQKDVKDRALNANETLFLFRLEYYGKVKKVSLPYTQTQVTSDKMEIGDSFVMSPGANGLAIRTTVSSDDLSKNPTINSKANKDETRNKTENFAIISSPTPEVVMVGTRISLTPKTANPAPVADCSNVAQIAQDVNMNLINLRNELCKQFPDVLAYGTHRGYCTYTCDHHDGYAVDIMISGDRGWMIAEWVRTHMPQYSVDNLIYEQHIWSVRYPEWRLMEDRGSLTANHFDHVHVSISRDAGPTPNQIVPVISPQASSVASNPQKENKPNKKAKSSPKNKAKNSDSTGVPQKVVTKPKKKQKSTSTPVSPSTSPTETIPSAVPTD